MQEFVGTRTSTQARSHAQKFFSKIEKFSNSNSPHKKEQSNSPKIKKLMKTESPILTEAKSNTEIFKVLENCSEQCENKITLDISSVFDQPSGYSRRLTYNGDELEGPSIFLKCSMGESMSCDNICDDLLKYDDSAMNVDYYDRILE